MIATRLIGGLGNQMFQYAAGRALALRVGSPLLLDVSGFANYELRRYELDGFRIDATAASAQQLARLGVNATPGTSLLARVLRKVWPQPADRILREASFTYDARIEQASAPVYLDGYWQSERYFARIRQHLLDEFTLKGDWGSDNAAMAAQIATAGAGAVSLHVRRGDYVSNAHTAQYHGVCSLDYYRDAVAHIGGRVEAPHFFVFSDDHEWVRENLQIGHPATFVQINSADHGIYDMMLMKSCRHHIIANSSFSWWGAWLNPAEDKIVVAPQRWFKDATNDTRDLIPAAWVRL
ncbi:alpha-1,2-fucosyltransferase [Herbaspirillum sp. YR522]|uniref:alpha-1,2-fucosyltransferase n=1 Tax=Herbaspirillum sp. YR522 TaxID=1144342 RepID=UPI00026F9151|nr:alpha-1,2-fucosyltransferase [Herbaspirillum sp. YR522]EJN00872.1 Glycosyl transferase family 11 [Herbaspirillum sp. YR522]